MPMQTMLTEELITQMTGFIAGGVTVEDACLTLGVTTRSFYGWRTRGLTIQRTVEEEAERSGQPSEALADALTLSQRMYLKFAENVTRAQAQSRVAAVRAVRNAYLQGGEEVSRTVEDYTETRLRSVRRTVMEAQPDGSLRPVTVAEEVPYEYKVKRERVTTRHTPPDGRLALEYLSRNDPEHWAQRKFVDVAWKDRAKEDLLRGVLSWDILAEAYGEDVAAGLFEEMGVVPPTQPQLLDAYE